MDRPIIFLTLAYAAAAVVFVVLMARLPRPSYRTQQAVEVTVTTDGPLQPEDLQAIGHLLTAHFEDPEAVFQAILDQVAKDEAAAGLDTALDRITGEGTR